MRFAIAVAAVLAVEGSSSSFSTQSVSALVGEIPDAAVVAKNPDIGSSSSSSALLRQHAIEALSKNGGHHHHHRRRRRHHRRLQTRGQSQRRHGKKKGLERMMMSNRRLFTSIDESQNKERNAHTDDSSSDSAAMLDLGMISTSKEGNKHDTPAVTSSSKFNDQSKSNANANGDSSYNGDGDGYAHNLDLDLDNRILQVYPPIAYAAALLCNNIYADQAFCETCQADYDIDAGTYNFEMNCQNITEDTRLIQALDYACLRGFCKTCEVDRGNFVVNMLGCSDEKIGDVVNDQFNLNYFLDQYLGSFCNRTEEESTKQPSCQVCGRKDQDEVSDSKGEAGGVEEESSFSFELDCPSEWSRTYYKFQYSIFYAHSFCYCPARHGVECTTCDVNIWDATVNIENCVHIAISDVEDVVEPESSCLSGSYDFYSNTDLMFLSMYGQLCNPLIASSSFFYYDNCTCQYDDSTQTASFRCQDEAQCEAISSYCPNDSLEFCETYLIDRTLSRNGTLKVLRCTNFTRPYTFSYCISYLTEKNNGNNTNDENSQCGMEVDGIECNSCSFVPYEDDELNQGVFGGATNVLYDCSNTVIGSNGPGDLYSDKIIDDTVAYFIYKSLPCDGGCNLCGDSGDKKMFLPNGELLGSEFSKDEEGIVEPQQRCFDAQLDSMSRVVSSEECQALRDSAQEPCGCKDPSPPETVNEESNNNKNTSNDTTSSTTSSSSATRTRFSAVLIITTTASFVSLMAVVGNQC